MATTQQLRLDPVFQQFVADTARKHGLSPEQLQAVIGAESNWDPMAVSSAGAVGLGQFMPETAEQYGVNPLDPRSSVEGAARYLSDLKTQFDGSWPLANAAYNWGPGNVQSWLETGLGMRGQQIPEETLGHVKKITGMELPMRGTQYLEAPAVQPLQQPMTPRDPEAGIADLFTPQQASVAPPAPQTFWEKFQAGLPQLGESLSAIGQISRGVPYQQIQQNRLAMENELAALQAKRAEAEQQQKLQKILDTLPEPVRTAAILDPKRAAEILLPTATDDSTALMKNWQYRNQLEQQFGKDTADAFWSAATGQGTNVSVQMPGAESLADQHAKEKAKYVSAQVTKFQDERAGATQQLDALGRMAAFLDMGLQSGGGAAARQGLTELSRELGLPFNFMTSPEEQFAADAARMVNDILNRAKGPQTDQDFVRALSTVPGLGKRPETNRALVGFMQSRAMIDRYFANKMNEAVLADLPGDTVKRYQEYAKLYSQVPASIPVRQNGEVIGFYHFSNEIPKMLDQGMTMEEAIQRWIKIYGVSK